jgi:cytochrome b561
MIAIHWLTALLMFCIIPIGLTMTALPHTSPVRETWFTTHKSIGITILALVILRVIVRATTRAPHYLERSSTLGPPVMARNAIVGAGFLIALLSSRDTNHRWAAEQASHLPPPWITGEAVLSEITHLCQRPERLT